MFYNKLNLSITDFCGKEENRPEIMGVLFGKKKTVATDTYTLIEVEAPKIDKNDFPVIPDTDPKEIDKEIILPTSAVKKISDNIPKNQSLPILENAVFIKADDSTAEFATTTLERTDKVNTRTIQGKFPDYKQIIPKEKPKMTIILDPRYLKRLCDFWIKNSNKARPKAMEFKIYDDKSPVMIETEFNKQQVKALIMPIKSN